jgi:hypothetical protein
MDKSAEKVLKDKRFVLGSTPEHPKFMYAHAPVPAHSRNTGSCGKDEIAGWNRQLAKANDEMRKDVELILASDREAIIIIAGDHGPFLTGDCHKLEGYDPEEITRFQLADRFHVFLALRWPDSIPKEQRYDEFLILQDIFPNIFATLTGSKEFLKARIIDTSNVMLLPGAIDGGYIQIGPDKGRPLLK